jgi:hypothetical protein
MRGSGFAREARRRPELDLLVGPLEAASIEHDDASPSDVTAIAELELVDPNELPTWREDG